MRFAALASYLILGWFTPWWSLIWLAAAWGYFETGYRRAAGTGALMAGGAWFCLILGWELAGSPAAQRLAGMFGINNKHLFDVLLILAAALIGAVSAGAGRWSRRLISE